VIRACPHSAKTKTLHGVRGHDTKVLANNASQIASAVQA
jgi:hypothetical protein